MKRIEIEVDGLRGWIYQRPRTSGGTVWYMDVADPTGRRRYATTKSLKTSSKTRAIDAAKRLLRSRLVFAADGGIEYLSQYWNPAESRKLKALKASGKAPGDDYIRKRRAIIDNHAIPWFTARGVSRLADITYSHCQDFLNEKSDELKPGTVAHLRSAVSAALQQAVREELIPSNPMRETERPRHPRQTREHIPWPQLEKILQPGMWSSQKAYTGALLSLSTGMRAGELRGLLWRYVDTDAGLVDVVHSLRESDYVLKPPKNGKPRYGLRLPSLTVRALKKLQPADVDPDGFVFTRPDGKSPVAHNFFLYHLKQAAKRAGVELSDRQTFHSLRHSAVSYGLSGGQDRARRDALLQMAGHADESIQSVYTHTTEAELDAIAAEWDKRFESIG